MGRSPPLPPTPRIVFSVSLCKRILFKTLFVLCQALRMDTPIHECPAVPFITGDKIFCFCIWWAMSSLLFLGACQKAIGEGISGFLPAPSKPNRLRFSTCAIEVSACIPAGGLPAHASSRPQAGASPTCPGIHPHPHLWSSPSRGCLCAAWPPASGGCSTGD